MAGATPSGLVVGMEVLQAPTGAECGDYNGLGSRLTEFTSDGRVRNPYVHDSVCILVTAASRTLCHKIW